MRQVAQHLGVAGQRGRFVIVVGKHRLHPQPLRQRRHGVAGAVVQHDEARPGMPVRRTQGAQGASSSTSDSRMNSTRRSARGSGSRMSRSNTNTHHTCLQVFSAWCSAALSVVRRSRRNHTSPRSKWLMGKDGRKPEAGATREGAA